MSSAEERLVLRPIPSYADLMMIADFHESVKCGMFIESDGSGYLATKDGMTRISVWDDEARYCVDDFTHVAWFNR